MSNEEITTQDRLRERVQNRDNTTYEARSGEHGEGWGYDAELDSRAADQIDELTDERDRWKRMCLHNAEIAESKDKRIDELIEIIGLASKSHDKSSGSFKDPTPVMSVEQLKQQRTPMTRD